MPAMDFTINEWAIVALVFVLGWLLGLASRSDRRWRRQYEDERAAHAALRRDHDDLQRDHRARTEAANTRIADLERHAPAVTAGTATAGAVAAAASGYRDDLTRIEGIDAHDEIRLNEAGVHSYRDLAALSGTDAAALEGQLGYTHGRIDSQHWREQAARLADGRMDVPGATRAPHADRGI
jgi:predicted flap endonuclease-1-like 5' DNA nuclease